MFLLSGLHSLQARSLAYGRFGWILDYRGRNFFVYLPPKKSREEQFRVNLRLTGWHWRMVGLDLPEDLKEHLAKELIKLTKDHTNP